MESKSEIQQPGNSDEYSQRILEVSVGKSSETLKGLSLVTSTEIAGPGKVANVIVDPGAQVFLISSEFCEVYNLSIHNGLAYLKEISLVRLKGYFLRHVPIFLGGKEYRWDFYGSPVESPPINWFGSDLNWNWTW